MRNNLCKGCEFETNKEECWLCDKCLKEERLTKIRLWTQTIFGSLALIVSILVLIFK